jgi:hypothetical protein
MSSPWNASQPSGGPVLCTSAYSSLHQEHLYLLEILAVEESRGERLQHALETTRAKLNNEEDLDTSPDSIKKLKKSIRGICCKLTRCQKTKRYLAESLATVVQSMKRLEQNQWHLANANYRRQAWYGLLGGIAQPSLDMVPVSPMAPELGQGMQELEIFSPPIPAFHHSLFPPNLWHYPLIPVMPTTPVIRTQMSISPYSQLPHPPMQSPMQSPTSGAIPLYSESQTLSPESEVFSAFSLGSRTLPQQGPMIEQVSSRTSGQDPHPWQASSYVSEPLGIQAKNESTVGVIEMEELEPRQVSEVRRTLSSTGYGSADMRRPKLKRQQHSV